MNLAQTQALFHSLICDGRNDSDSLKACFTGTPDLPPEERISIYSNMVRARLEDALRNDFPKLAVLIGRERFAALAVDYVRAHPSRHPSLSHLGKGLAQFLEKHPGERPDFADLAALEWARNEVFEEAPATPLTPVALAAFLPAAFAALRLRFVPALRLLQLPHDAAALWKSIEAEQPASDAISALTHLAVWRLGFEVFHARIAADEASALEQAMAGARLDEVCLAFAAHLRPAESAARVLGSWLSDGWIAEANFQ